MGAMLIAVMCALFLAAILALAWGMWGIVFVAVAIWELMYDA